MSLPLYDLDEIIANLTLEDEGMVLLPFPALTFYSGPRRRMPACLAELILAVSPLSHSVKMELCVSLAGLSPAIVRTTQSNCQASGWEILLETDFHQRR